MSTLSVAPQGFWLKTHFYVEGSMLNAVTYSCIAGNPEIFRMSVDLRPIIAAVVKGHNQLHADMKVSGEDVRSALVGSLFGDITKPFANVANSAAKMVKKVGKSKLVSQLGHTVKAVVKSKVTGGILAGTAIVFPPVGGPAVAAYATANAALMAIDQAKAAVTAAKKVVNKATDPKTAALFKGQLTKWAGATVQKAIADKVHLPTGPGGKALSTIAQAVKLANDRASQAKSVIAAIAKKAKAGDVEAKKMARVIVLAKSAQDKLKEISKAHPKALPHLKQQAPKQLNGFPALLISRSGHIIPGRYVEKAGAERAVIVRQGKVLRGSFAAVSGDDIFGADVNQFGSIGCSNPFLRPAHLR